MDNIKLSIIAEDYESGTITEHEARTLLLDLLGVSGSLPSEEEIREPMQNALYATGNFLADECTELATGILEYLQDAGYKVVRQ